MFERFTDRARRVLVLAQEESKALNHDFLGTEHILLGVLRETDGVGAKALTQLGLNVDDVRARVVDTIGRGETEPVGPPPFTPRSKKVLELSLRQALMLGHNYIGTEHILLGLLHEGEGVGAQVLLQAGVELSTVRQTVIEILAGHGTPPTAEDRRPQVGNLTPAADTLRVHAQFAAGRGRVGSHHFLQAMFADERSLAAKVLLSLGVTGEAVAERIQSLGTAGTTDEVEPPASPPRFEMRFDDGFTIQISDAELAGRVAAALPGVGGNLGKRVRDALIEALGAEPFYDAPAEPEQEDEDPS